VKQESSGKRSKTITAALFAELLFSGLLLTGFLFTVLLFPPGLHAQNPPYLLPQTIYVGDSGRLVVPLSQAFRSIEPFVWDTPEKLPESSDMVIRRIELEHRGTGSRLLIDFIPYAPGTLSFPPLEFLSSEPEPLVLTDITAQVASILTPSQMALSEPASPLAVPGTSLLVYGTIILVLVILFLGIGGTVWGRRHFGELWERFRRRHLLRVMTKFLRRLKQEAVLAGSAKAGYYLTLLSLEFREFLSVFTGINCRSLTAGEFLDLPQLYTGHDIPADKAEESQLTPVFLCRLFRNWDTLRFSGRGIEMKDFVQALNETGSFISALDKAEKEQPFTKTVRDPAEGIDMTAGAYAPIEVRPSVDSGGERS